MAVRQTGSIRPLDPRDAKTDVLGMPIEHKIAGLPTSLKQREATTRALWQAMSRGLTLRCPNCGIGRLFGAYLKVNASCPHCQEELHHQRTDDAPPYFVILIVGHIVVGAALAVEVAFAPPMWVQMTAWPLVAIALCLLLLPCIKGALIGLQWAFRMHGFDPATRKTGTAFIDYDPFYQEPADDRLA